VGNYTRVPPKKNISFLSGKYQVYAMPGQLHSVLQHARMNASTVSGRRWGKNAP